MLVYLIVQSIFYEWKRPRALVSGYHLFNLIVCCRQHSCRVCYNAAFFFFISTAFLSKAKPAHSLLPYNMTDMYLVVLHVSHIRYLKPLEHCCVCHCIWLTGIILCTTKIICEQRKRNYGPAHVCTDLIQIIDCCGIAQPYITY